MKPEFETKENRFVRIAQARTNKAIDMIDLIGNLSNTSIYAFTFDQVDHIFTAIQESLAEAKQRFCRPCKPQRRRFSLSEPYILEDPCPASIPPTICVALPDGTSLRAVAHNGDDYPSIDIFWDTDGYLSGDKIAFAEYNPNRDLEKRLCIGAYQLMDDEPTYYESYHGGKENNG